MMDGSVQTIKGKHKGERVPPPHDYSVYNLDQYDEADVFEELWDEGPARHSRPNAVSALPQKMSSTCRRDKPASSAACFMQSSC